jgi:hypothetical protein
MKSMGWAWADVNRFVSSVQYPALWYLEYFHSHLWRQVQVPEASKIAPQWPTSQFGTAGVRPETSTLSLMPGLAVSKYVMIKIKQPQQSLKDRMCNCITTRAQSCILNHSAGPNTGRR